jgi:hypothetical protein
MHYLNSVHSEIVFAPIVLVRIYVVPVGTIAEKEAFDPAVLVLSLPTTIPPTVSVVTEDAAIVNAISTIMGLPVELV